MPDALARTPGIDDSADALRRAAAEAVATVPGVVQLEPTLTHALRRLQNATRLRGSSSPGPAYAPTDGVQLTRRPGAVDVHVDVTVSTAAPAHQTARAVQDALRAVVLAHGLTPGDVTVGVLRLRS